MNYALKKSDFKNKSIFLTTPMYGGNCHGLFTKGVVGLSRECEKYKVEMDEFFIFNESLVTRARNYCVDEFLRSDKTHLVFIDSDIGFNPIDVLGLVKICDYDSGYGVVSAPYPKKTIAWEKVYAAASLDYVKEDPKKLVLFAGDFVVNTDEKAVSLNKPLEVRNAGTGFMVIHRKVFEQYAETYPELTYRPDHVRIKNFSRDREIVAYFDTMIDPESKRYLSEDYMFCQNVRKMGHKVWMCPWVNLFHIGSYRFTGSMPTLLKTGLPLTY